MVVFDEDFLKVIKALKEQGGLTYKHIRRIVGEKRKKIDKILDFLAKYKLAITSKSTRHYIVVKTDNLDDFYSYLMKVIEEVEEKLTKYSPPSPEPVDVDISELFLTLPKEGVIMLAYLYERGPQHTHAIAQAARTNPNLIKRIAMRFEAEGFCKVQKVGRLVVVSLTPRGLYLGKKLTEILKLLEERG